MDIQEAIFGDFKVRVRYTNVEAQFMKRYHIECVDMPNLIVVFTESNVTGVNDFIPLDKAVNLIREYYTQRFGFDILSLPKKGDSGRVRNVHC